MYMLGRKAFPLVPLSIVFAGDFLLDLLGRRQKQELVILGSLCRLRDAIRMCQNQPSPHQADFVLFIARSVVVLVFI